MIGSVKVIEAAFVSELMKVPIAILWPQKDPPELRARSGSSRELNQSINHSINQSINQYI